ncbi:MAG: YceI family protein [Hyphomicrobiaceae bacterium]|nr:YceI family protein [Hyphomicrobiaceae bacterium]
MMDIQSSLRRRNVVPARVTAAVLALAWAISPAPASAQTFTFDPDHTEIRFSWDHLGLSRQSGVLRKASGKLEYDPANPEASRLEVIMRIDDLTTGVPALDRLMKETPDIWNASAHPEITFRSTSVTMSGPTTANVGGDLTLNGQTLPAMLSVSLNYAGAHPLAEVNPVYQGVEVLGFSARTQILRSQWGITRSVPLVSDEIRISIETELLRQ